MRFQEYQLQEKNIIRELRQEIFWKLEKNCREILRLYKKANYHFLYRGVKRAVGDYRLFTPRTDRQPKNTPIDIHKYYDYLFQKKFGWKARSEGVFTGTTYSEATIYYGGEEKVTMKWTKDFFGKKTKKPPNMGIFFPFDGFKYLWSPEVDDLFSEYEDNPEIYNDDPDSAYDEWYETYGEGYNGYYEYDGETWDNPDYPWEMLRDLEQEKIELDDDDEERRLEIEDEMEYWRNATNNAEWVPTVEFDEWYENKYSSGRAEEHMEYLVSTYKNKGLEDLLRKSRKYGGKEVMVKCKKYYLVNAIYIDELQRMIKLWRG